MGGNLDQALPSLHYIEGKPAIGNISWEYSPRLAEKGLDTCFLAGNRQKVQWISRDGIGKVYLFSPSEVPESESPAYMAQWGIYHPKALQNPNTDPAVKISTDHRYRTALIFRGKHKKRIRLNFRESSPRSLIELSVWHQGSYEGKKLFLVNTREESMPVEFKKKGRYKENQSE